MFSREQTTGNSLPDKTLCLTFDDGPGETPGDGPGPKTQDLAEYLHEQGIGAAFFFTGKHLYEHPTVMRRVVRLGHIVGNHSYSHQDMPDFFSKGGDVGEEIRKVERLMAPVKPAASRYFRAPYGYWNESLSAYLNENLGGNVDYIGPVYWDISASDFDYWARAASASECARAYLAEIRKIGRGIVLMHDSTADYEIMKKNNLTLETVRILTPELKRLGYTFVNLDSIL